MGWLIGKIGSLCARLVLWQAERGAERAWKRHERHLRRGVAVEAKCDFCLDAQAGD